MIWAEFVQFTFTKRFKKLIKSPKLIEHYDINTQAQLKKYLDERFTNNVVENMVFKAIGFAALCPSTNQIQALAEKRIKVSLSKAKLLINEILYNIY